MEKSLGISKFSGIVIISGFYQVTGTKIYSDIKANSQPPALDDNPELFCG